MAESDSDVRVVMITAPNAEVGETLARSLVEQRLAAAVNLVPGVHSVYRWKGRVSTSAEVLLVVKTRSDRCRELADHVAELHPYELPQVLELPVLGGSSAYLEWVRTESSP